VMIRRRVVLAMNAPASYAQNGPLMAYTGFTEGSTERCTRFQAFSLDICAVSQARPVDKRARED